MLLSTPNLFMHPVEPSCIETWTSSVSAECSDRRQARPSLEWPKSACIQFSHAASSHPANCLLALVRPLTSSYLARRIAFPSFESVSPLSREAIIFCLCSSKRASTVARRRAVTSDCLTCTADLRCSNSSPGDTSPRITCRFDSLR